jgi:uncharacterized Zn-binding protein involved in type VI secretion
MPDAARISDMHTCPKVEPGPTPHVGGPIDAGSPDVIIEFQPAARAGVDTAVCAAGGPDKIRQGCGTVDINFKPAARMGDGTTHGGVIVKGAATVVIGVAGDAVDVLPLDGASGVASSQDPGSKGDAKQGSEGSEGSPDASPEKTAAEQKATENKKVTQGVTAAFDLAAGSRVLFGRTASFECKSWDPDTGGSAATPNPSDIVRRQWEVLLPDGVVTQTSALCTISVPELDASTPVPLTITVRLTVEDRQGDTNIIEQSFPVMLEIRHAVTLFPQPTNMTCWSAAATMMLGGHQSIGPGSASTGASGGLNSSDANVEKFAKSFGLILHYPQSWTIPGLAQIMRRGPLWVGGRVPSLHAVVFAEMSGDGTPGGTIIKIYDPWPPNVGKVYSVLYSARIQAYPESTIFILHR